jgi:hypothetical protein
MTKYEKIRNAEIERHLANTGCTGSKGRAFELTCARKNSRKTRVSKQGENDVYIKYGKGFIKAECKTNGGRIESLYAVDAPRFVIYRLDMVQKHKATKTQPARGEHRYVAPVIIPTDLFLAVLESFNAIKSTNGKNPELAIQVSSKKWYEWLQQYPVEFHTDWDYTAEDFEGLGL